MKKLIGRIKLRLLKWLLQDICKRRGGCSKCEFSVLDEGYSCWRCTRRDALLQWEAEDVWLFANDGIND